MNLSFFSEEQNVEFLRFPICNVSAMPPVGMVNVNPHLVPALDAAYAFAVALKEAWSQRCRHSPGLCPQLVQMRNEVHT